MIPFLHLSFPQLHRNLLGLKINNDKKTSPTREAMNCFSYLSEPGSGILQDLAPWPSAGLPGFIGPVPPPLLIRIFNFNKLSSFYIEMQCMSKEDHSYRKTMDCLESTPSKEALQQIME
jgi:hypothetical protein